MIPLTTFTKVMKKYGFTNADELTTYKKEFVSSLSTNDQKECGKRKRQSQQNIASLYGVFWVQSSHTLQY